MKPGETILFPYIVFKSRAHRDRVNAKVMKTAYAEDDKVGTNAFRWQTDDVPRIQGHRLIVTL